MTPPNLLPDVEEKKHALLIQDKYSRLIHWSVFLKKDWNFKLDPSQLKSTEKLRILWNRVIKNILNVYKSDTQSTIFTRSRFSKLHYTCERLMLTMGHWHYCLLPLLKFIILIIKTDWRFLSFFFCYFSWVEFCSISMFLLIRGITMNLILVLCYRFLLLPFKHVYLYFLTN